MAALWYVDVPGYAAILFRQSYSDLALPGAIMDRSKEWLSGTAAHWNDNTKTWTFPCGATLTFGYLENDRDKYRYQGAEFSFCGFDELTQFPETVYRYLFSRLRRLTGSTVPLRMRAATNPGGVGHEWVFQRFLVEGKRAGRLFMPAFLADNPYLDQAAYLESLKELDPHTRAQLLAGDWFARPPGTKFRREWFTIVDEAPAAARSVRFWDLAATAPRSGADPDWTCGALVSVLDGRYYIRDIRRTRATPGSVEALVKQTAELDGHAVDIWMEEEGGSGGKITIDNYARKVLVGWTFRGIRSTGDKELRANPVSSAAEAGNVLLVRGAWISEFLDEAESFPGGSHDDQIDAVSGAVAQLTTENDVSSFLASVRRV